MDRRTTLRKPFSQEPATVHSASLRAGWAEVTVGAGRGEPGDDCGPVTVTFCAVGVKIRLGENGP